MLTHAEIKDRNARIAGWYSPPEEWPMRRIVAKTGLTYRQIYRILVKSKVPNRGWQDKRLKRNGHV